MPIALLVVALGRKVWLLLLLFISTAASTATIYGCRSLTVPSDRYIYIYTCIDIKRTVHVIDDDTLSCFQPSKCKPKAFLNPFVVERVARRLLTGLRLKLGIDNNWLVKTNAGRAIFNRAARQSDRNLIRREPRVCFSTSFEFQSTSSRVVSNRSLKHDAKSAVRARTSCPRHD